MCYRNYRMAIYGPVHHLRWTGPLPSPHNPLVTVQLTFLGTGRLTFLSVLLVCICCQKTSAQRDSIFGLDSTILAHNDLHSPLYWASGKLRSQFKVTGDSAASMKGYREDGGHWFDADYTAWFGGDTVIRGYKLIRYKQYYTGTERLQVECNALSEIDTTNEFAPVEEWITYFTSGKIRSASQFDHWLERSGKYVEYHKNGTERWRGQYCVRMVETEPVCDEDTRVDSLYEIRSSNLSMKCGTWEQYDRCGELLETVTYDWK